MFFVFRHVSTSLQFFSECHEAEEWMRQKEESLNGHFSQSDFKLVSIASKLLLLYSSLAVGQNEVGWRVCPLAYFFKRAYCL